MSEQSIEGFRSLLADLKYKDYSSYVEGTISEECFAIDLQQGRLDVT